MHQPYDVAAILHLEEAIEVALVETLELIDHR